MSSMNNERMLMEMALVGNINSKLCVLVRTNDTGKIPHFHIWDPHSRRTTAQPASGSIYP